PVPAERAGAGLEDPRPDPAACVFRTAAARRPLPGGPARLRLRQGADVPARALAGLPRQVFPEPPGPARAGGGDGHPPPAEGLRPPHAGLRRDPRPAGARAADQGRQALARRDRRRGAGGEARPGQGLWRHRERAGLLRRVEAGPRPGAPRDLQLAGDRAGLSPPRRAQAAMSNMRPIRPEASMAAAPQNTTRIAPRQAGAPPRRAAVAPVSDSPTSVATVVTAATCACGATTALTIGSAAP